MTDHNVALNDLVKDARQIIKNKKIQDKASQATECSSPVDIPLCQAKFESPKNNFFDDPHCELVSIVKEEQTDEDFTNYSIKMNLSFYRPDAMEVVNFINHLLTPKPSTP